MMTDSIQILDWLVFITDKSLDSRDLSVMNTSQPRIFAPPLHTVIFNISPKLIQHNLCSSKIIIGQIFLKVAFATDLFSQWQWIRRIFYSQMKKWQNFQK